MASQADGSNFIQVGDFGMGYRGEKFETKFLELMNEELAGKGQTLYAIRGNHDDPYYFQGNHIYSNVKLLPDYSVERIEDKTYLFIGGATSIDRKQNTLNVDYWSDEGFRADFEKIRTRTDINVVISHTAPQDAYPQTMGRIVYEFAKFDSTLLADLNMERTLVTAAYQEICRNNPGLIEWWYGHFHSSRSEYIGSVRFRLLNIKEAAE